MIKLAKWHVPPFVIHILVWMLIYTFPMLMLLAQETSHSWHARQLASVPFFTVMACFYSNYSYLVPKLLFAKKYILFIVINIAIFTALLSLIEVWKGYVVSAGFLRHMQFDSFYVSFIKGFASFLFVVGLAISTYSATLWFRSRDTLHKLELENANAKLSSLKVQISPHFLFNTLNNVLALIDENSELAKKSVVQLSNLLRSMLYEFEKDAITIEQEAQFLRDYSDLMLLRYGGGLKFKLETELSEPNATISPLLLIPLMENVFKHGVGPSLEASSISVKITSKNGKITFESTNTYFPKTNQDKSGSGIGVDNTKKRLAMLYEGSYFYDSKIAGENYITKLELRA